MQFNQAKVETFRKLKFRLGYCGSDEEVKAIARLEGRKALSVNSLILIIYEKRQWQELKVSKVKSTLKIVNLFVRCIFDELRFH